MKEKQEPDLRQQEFKNSSDLLAQKIEELREKWCQETNTGKLQELEQQIALAVKKQESIRALLQASQSQDNQSQKANMTQTVTVIGANPVTLTGARDIHAGNIGNIPAQISDKGSTPPRPDSQEKNSTSESRNKEKELSTICQKLNPGEKFKFNR